MREAPDTTLGTVYIKIRTSTLVYFGATEVPNEDLGTPTAGEGDFLNFCPFFGPAGPVLKIGVFSSKIVKKHKHKNN